MNTRDAATLIAKAANQQGGTWADLGAGAGTFTRALAQLLGPESRIYAVDRDPHAVAALERWAASERANVIPIRAEFTRGLGPESFDDAALDGILLANALHFVRDAPTVLANLVRLVRPGGRVVLVEYDRRAPSRWVPYPIPRSDLPALAAGAGLTPFTVTATRPSAYEGELYAAASDRETA